MTLSEEMWTRRIEKASVISQQIAGCVGADNRFCLCCRHCVSGVGPSPRCLASIHASSEGLSTMATPVVGPRDCDPLDMLVSSAVQLCGDDLASS